MDSKLERCVRFSEAFPKKKGFHTKNGEEGKEREKNQKIIIGL